MVAKQALPYVRCVGESWPLTLERARFECKALREQRELCPDRVPEVLHFDGEKALIGECVYCDFIEDCSCSSLLGYALTHIPVRLCLCMHACQSSSLFDV